MDAGATAAYWRDRRGEIAAAVPRPVGFRRACTPSSDPGAASGGDDPVLIRETRRRALPGAARARRRRAGFRPRSTAHRAAARAHPRTLCRARSRRCGLRRLPPRSPGQLATGRLAGSGRGRPDHDRGGLHGPAALPGHGVGCRHRYSAPSSHRRTLSRRSRFCDRCSHHIASESFSKASTWFDWRGRSPTTVSSG